MTPEQIQAIEESARASNAKCPDCGHPMGCHLQDGCTQCGCGAPPELPVVDWHWIDRDGPPARTDRYLAAYATSTYEGQPCGLTEELYWDGETWTMLDTDGKPHPFDNVVAWVEMPAFPTRTT